MQRSGYRVRACAPISFLAGSETLGSTNDNRWGGSVGFVFNKRFRLGKGLVLNLSKSGASVSKRIGRLTLSSNGRGNFRLFPGLSFRFGKKH